MTLWLVDMDIGMGEADEPEQELYDCCICSQCTASTNERLVGLVALLQPSNGRLPLALTVHSACVYFSEVCCINPHSTQFTAGFEQYTHTFIIMAAQTSWIYIKKETQAVTQKHSREKQIMWVLCGPRLKRNFGIWHFFPV